MFFGGVTRRFPELRCAFLEGGVGWAVGLFNDIVGHWEKRNRDAVQKYDPARLDQAQLLELLREHGGPIVARHDAELEAYVATQARRAQSDGVDDFAAAGIETPDDLVERFVPHFFFGCEADDPANALAFDTRVNAFGAKLGAIFTSDIGHWDVPDITAVLERGTRARRARPPRRRRLPRFRVRQHGAPLHRHQPEVLRRDGGRGRLPNRGRGARRGTLSRWYPDNAHMLDECR